MKWVIVFLVAIIFSSCSKKEDFTVTIKGKVIDEITGKPVPNLPIVLVGKYNCFIGCERKDLGFTNTDKEGEYVFSFERTGENYENYASYYVECNRKDVVDTNAIEWQYDLIGWIDAEKTTEYHLETARNTGGLRISVLNLDKWHSEDIEWLFVQSTNFKDTIKEGNGALYFNEVASQTHTIKWYYKKNGIVSKVFQDEVYIHNRYRDTRSGQNWSYGIHIE